MPATEPQTSMHVLTTEEREHFTAKMVDARDATPVRFLHDGCAVFLQDGEKCSRGCNVMHQPVYWNFTRETAREIAKLTGCRAVFSA